MNLIGISGIADMLGVSKQRASQLADPKHGAKGFPKRLDGPPPDDAKPLPTGPVWKHDTVERWAKKSGRI